MLLPRTRILVIIAILLVLLSCVSTYAFLVLRSSSSGGDFGDQRSRRFDVFDGYNQCKKMVRESVNGKVISIESDDRAAQYNRAGNLNMLFFAVDYSEKQGMFGYSGGQLKRLYARCEVSAGSNRIEAIKLRPADEKEYTEIIRRPE
jgi:hypothetical protein